MDYLIRFTQTHESFRRPEIEALSTHASLKHKLVSYNEHSPFCILRFPALSRQQGNSAAHDPAIDVRVRDFGSRSILAKGIYEIWGQGRNYEELHEDIRTRSQHLWATFRQKSFRFSFDCYGSTRLVEQQRQIINSLSYLDFKGEIKMKNAEAEFTIMEEWLPTTLPCEASVNGAHAEPIVDPVAETSLRRVFLARKIGDTSRWLREKHDLKKRPYISTTSMDAELALLTASMALASPGKIFLDPFVGTGGFMVAAAELGALVLGTDIDGRSFRGKGTGLDEGVGANLKKYGLSHLFGDCMTSDLTNTPFRSSSGPGAGRWLGGIICDPPYGVREGLKVLGTKFRPSRAGLADVNGETSSSLQSNIPSTAIMVNGVPAHTLPGYIAPKKPYSFTRMLDDILDFAVRTLVDGGRLAFWMPSANENEFGEEEATAIPMHRHLALKHECVQRFNKWSRRLLVFERLPGRCDPERDLAENATEQLAEVMVDSSARTANELNPFRRRYFQAFVAEKNGS